MPTGYRHGRDVLGDQKSVPENSEMKFLTMSYHCCDNRASLNNVKSIDADTDHFVISSITSTRLKSADHVIMPHLLVGGGGIKR